MLDLNSNKRHPSVASVLHTGNSAVKRPALQALELLPETQPWPGPNKHREKLEPAKTLVFGRLRERAANDGTPQAVRAS